MGYAFFQELSRFVHNACKSDTEEEGNRVIFRLGKNYDAVLLCQT